MASSASSYLAYQIREQPFVSPVRRSGLRLMLLISPKSLKESKRSSSRMSFSMLVTMMIHPSTATIRLLFTLQWLRFSVSRNCLSLIHHYYKCKLIFNFGNFVPDRHFHIFPLFQPYLVFVVDNYSAFLLILYLFFLAGSYIMHFMNSKSSRIAVEAANLSQPSNSDSEQFQDLQIPNKANQSALATLLRNPNPLIVKSPEEIGELMETISKLEKEIHSHEQHEQYLRDEKNKYTVLYQSSVQECLALKEKNENFLTENKQLRQINMELRECAINFKDEKEEALQKINCLQSKLKLEKAEYKTKINLIKRSFQPMTKTTLKADDEDGFVKLLTIKFQEMEKLVSKISEIQTMISKVAKAKVNPEKLDTIEEKFEAMERIEGLLVRQSQRITALKQHAILLQQQINQGKGKSNSVGTNLGKLFSPVINFCKPEEERKNQSKHNI